MTARSTSSILPAALLILAGLSSAAFAATTTPPTIIQTVEPRFPVALEYSPLAKGEAEVAIQIDAAGQLTDCLVTGYTHEDFASEAVKALRQWRFEPARRDGEPVEIRVSLNFQFTTKRVVTLMPGETTGALIRNAGIPSGINLLCTPQELDRPLAVLHPATPVHPGRLADLPNGRTVLDFFVDETGRARLPVVIESTHPAFAEAAVRALADWKFAVPKRDGRPVIVRMQQEFLFSNES